MPNLQLSTNHGNEAVDVFKTGHALSMAEHVWLSIFSKAPFFVRRHSSWGKRKSE
jgi:hypothetical protein